MKEFWKSKTFWAALTVVLSNALALFASLGIFGLSGEISAALLAVWNSLLGVLAIVWRWNADTPLSMRNQPPLVRRRK